MWLDNSFSRHNFTAICVKLGHTFASVTESCSNIVDWLYIMSSRQEKEKKRSASYILMMRFKSAHALRGRVGQVLRFAAAVCWVAVLMPLIKAEATLLRMGFSSSSGTFKPATMYLKMSA
jgi:hypothetical protein